MKLEAAKAEAQQRANDTGKTMFVIAEWDGYYDHFVVDAVPEDHDDQVITVEPSIAKGVDKNVSTI